MNKVNERKLMPDSKSDLKARLEDALRNYDLPLVLGLSSEHGIQVDNKTLTKYKVRRLKELMGSPEQYDDLREFVKKYTFSKEEKGKIGESIYSRQLKEIVSGIIENDGNISYENLARLERINKDFKLHRQSLEDVINSCKTNEEQSKQTNVEILGERLYESFIEQWDRNKAKIVNDTYQLGKNPDSELLARFKQYENQLLKLMSKKTPRDELVQYARDVGKFNKPETFVDNLIQKTANKLLSKGHLDEFETINELYGLGYEVEHIN